MMYGLCKIVLELQIHQNKPLQARSQVQQRLNIEIPTFTHAQAPVLTKQPVFISQVWWLESCIEPVTESSETKCVVKWDKVSLYVLLIFTQRAGPLLHIPVYSINHHIHQPWTWIWALWLYPDFTAGMKHHVWHQKAGLHVFAVHILVIRCTTSHAPGPLNVGFPNAICSAYFVVLWISAQKILLGFQIILFKKIICLFKSKYFLGLTLA